MNFDAWRTASVEHEIAFEREASTWERLDRLAALGPSQAWPDPDLLATPEGHRSACGGPRRWAALAASALILLSSGGALLLSVSASPAYATGVGERRLVVLADGTTVELNTASKIVVRYARGRRLVELVRGEAMFHIASDPRPFAIQTPDLHLGAKTGDVSVRLTGAGSTLMVKDGAVFAESSAASSSAGAGATLGPGSAAAVGPEGAQVRQVSADELDRVLAWRQGAIALSGQTLGEAVLEFNRYNARKISIGDSATARIRVGGYFQTSDVNGFVGAVQKTFPVEASRTADGGILLSRAG